MEYELSRLVDSLPGLVWTALPDGQVDLVNRRWSDYTGQGVDLACGSGWQTAVHPEDLPELLKRWASMLAGKPGDMEARLRRFDGTYRWFLFRSSPWVDASGEIVKWCGVTTDIEDRRLRGPYALDYRARWWLSKRAREGHFESIADGTPCLAALLKPGQGVEHVNRQALEYFGATLADLYDWVAPGSIHPDDVATVLAVRRESDETGRSYDVVARRRRADGVYRWFQMRRFPLLDTEGKIYFWYIVETDVDDLKRAESLLTGEKRLLEMVAAGDALPVVLDALCRLVGDTVSGCYCGILFFDPGGTKWQLGSGPALPSGYNETMHGRPAHRESGPCGLAAFLKEPVIVPDLESDLRWDASGFRALALKHGLRSCWSSPILSKDEKALGALAIYQHEPGSPTPFHRELIARFSQVASIAVERSRSESALRRSETFLAEAQRLSLTGSFSWRVMMNEITWSEQAHRIFEFDPGVPVTVELLASRIHPEDMPLVLEMIERARSDTGAFEYEHRLQMPDGSVKYLHLVARGTRDQDDRLEYIGAVQDVTRSRLSEEALGKARSELAHMARVTSLGALTASIAHEVNQPLSGIITNASTCLRMLATDPPNVDGARETAHRTLRDGNRASEVISRLRALFVKRAVTTESVDLNDAAREVLALSRSELLRNRVVIRQELADELPLVAGDRVQLQQVILNLLLNASDAMSGVEGRSRQLVIKTEREEGDSRVRLSVQDSGVGFEPNTLDRIFEPFYTTKTGGMGIGLAVSHSIIESHRGRLWGIANDGSGVTFSFSIPLGSESPRMRPSHRAMARLGRATVADAKHVQ